VMLIAAVAIIGLGLSAIGPMWAQEAQREREQELLRVGAAYAAAIRAYRDGSPGSLKRYPPSLQSLVLDTRFVGTTRHLRRLYADPLMPNRAWGTIYAPDGGVKGVYSMDDRQPLLRTAIALGTVELPPARKYSDWRFVAEGTP